VWLAHRPPVVRYVDGGRSSQRPRRRLRLIRARAWVPRAHQFRHTGLIVATDGPLPRPLSSLAEQKFRWAGLTLSGERGRVERRQRQVGQRGVQYGWMCRCEARPVVALAGAPVPDAVVGAGWPRGPVRWWQPGSCGRAMSSRRGRISALVQISTAWSSDVSISSTSLQVRRGPRLPSAGLLLDANQTSTASIGYPPRLRATSHGLLELRHIDVLNAAIAFEPRRPLTPRSSIPRPADPPGWLSDSATPNEADACHPTAEMSAFDLV